MIHLRGLFLVTASISIFVKMTCVTCAQQMIPATGEGSAAERLNPPARPARPGLPASKLPIEFIHGERIALVGSSLAERMSRYGFFEAMLHTRFPQAELVVRNFAWPADEVSLRQRPSN